MLIEYAVVNGNGETLMRMVNLIHLFAWLLGSLRSASCSLLVLISASDLLPLDLEVLSQLTSHAWLASETQL